MGNYGKLLLAVDLSEESSRVAARAVKLREETGAELHLIHVIEPLGFAYGGDMPMDFSGIQEEIHLQARARVEEFGASHGIAQANQHIVPGRPHVEIHSLAEALPADLIVIGSHGRHGLALLMGSTADAVLHGASCDVLAVRIGG